MKVREFIKTLDAKEKFLLIVPLLVLPFVSFGFYVLGGGAGKQKSNAKAGLKVGFNTKLPKANLKDEKRNKMQFYEQAAKDSARFKEMMRSDPYFKRNAQELHGSHDSLAMLPSDKDFGSGTFTGKLLQQKDPNEEKVYAKIAQLNAQLEKSKRINQGDDTDRLNQLVKGTPSVHSPEVDRLETMMRKMKEPSSPDTEMQQINAMLDKIMDIQNPDRVKDKMRQESGLKKTKVYPVTTTRSSISISVLEGQKTDATDSIVAAYASSINKHNRFFSLENVAEAENEMLGSIRATIDEAQTVVSGAIVELRLQDDVYIKGILIPKGNSVYGVASLNGERLEVNIASVRYKNYVLPVSLSVYDLDGLPGFYVRGSIGRDVSKQSTDQAVQSLSLASLDPSLAAQATSAGIEAAKSLLSKKVKLVQVTLKPGYKVLLRDNNDKS